MSVEAKGSHSQQVLVGSVVRKQTLHASITRACVECGAPGKFQNDMSFIANYPELYRPAWAGRDVGENCPHCGRKRAEDENLGELWSREFRTPDLLQRLKKWVRSVKERVIR